MKELLAIRILADEKFCEWVVYKDNNIITSGNGALTDLTPLATDYPQIVTHCYLPSERGTVVNVDMPNYSRAALDTIPFQIEEHISEPIEQCHYAYNITKSSSLRVVACSKKLVTTWIDFFEEMELNVQLISFDCFLLTHSQSNQYLVENGRAVFNTPAYQGAIPESLLQHFLQKLDIAPLACDQKGTRLSKNEDVNTSNFLDNYLEELGQLKPINLLFGPFSKSNQSTQLKKLLLPPCIAASIALTLWLGMMFTNNYQLTERINQADQAMHQLYKKLFPNAKRIINPASQMRANLKQHSTLQKNDTFISLLTRITPIINPNQLSIRSIRYDQASKDMHLVLFSSDFPPLEALREQIKQLPTETRLGELTQTENGITGTLSLTTNGGKGD